MTAAALPRRQFIATVPALAAWLGGCSLAPPAVPEARAPAIDGRPVVLFGEVHDSRAQHALRLQALQKLLATGARPALLMEQFDRERQAAIDSARSGAAPVRAQALVDAAGGRGWDWALYRPYLDEALAHGLPILAANVSRTDARRVISEGLAAAGFDPQVPAAVLAAQAQAIVASHCGQVDAAMARRMAGAQVARDQFMARLVEQHQARGVVLLAGNGHVRKDIGVPQWLSPATRARTLVVGMLEVGDGDAAAYDTVVYTPRQVREDPCAAMRMPAQPAGAASGTR